MGAMSRVLGIAKMIGSLLAIEVFVPAARSSSDSPLHQSHRVAPAAENRPTVSRGVPACVRVDGERVPATGAASQS